MPRRPIDRPVSWSDGVTALRVVGASPKALERINRDLGLGFSADELLRIQRYFAKERRDPTDVELAGIAQSWSEHCSYKSSRRFLKAAFGSLHAKPKVLGTGDAGVIRFDGPLAYAIRIESHNHPSAVEPYGGAATGIGGILRDVLAVGAKPIALVDPLFFGPLDLTPEETPPGIKTPRYLMGGVVAGIRDYGNRVGVPTVNGGLFFDPSYTVNPLVNVGCVGILPKARLRPNRARRVGDRLVLTGGFTGRDGMGGVAFASRELTEQSEEESRGAVQLGNPIMKEPLIHACLESFDRGLVEGLKDLGGGGLASASGELVHAGAFGSRIHLDRVPLRETGLLPWEIWISESQERMILDVRPENLQELLGIFRRNDVPATDIGEVTRGPYEELFYHDRPAARLDIGFRVDPPMLRRPTRVRPRRKPAAPPRVDDDPVTLLQELVLAPDSVSRESVMRVYDHEVQGRTVVKALQGRVTSPSHGDATVLRPTPESWAGLAVTVAAQPWLCQESPKIGGAAVVEEAARNLYAVGARPDAFTNCLNFGNPEDPRVLGDFSAVVAGMASAARALGMAVPSGNVSFYNGGLGREIPPTPVLLATGIVPDLRAAVTVDLKRSGNPIYLLGRSDPSLGGSLFARRRSLRGLSVPPVDPAALRRLGEMLLRAGREGWVRSAHDVSDGGLAVTLSEMAFGGGLGFSVDLDATGLAGPGIALASEGRSRWVVEVSEESRSAFERCLKGLPVTRLGTVDEAAHATLRWSGRTIATIPIAPLYERWRAGLGVP